MTDATKYSGACFCGEVQLEVSGEPLISGYCHCADCRVWSGTPITAWVKWPYEALRIAAGEASLITYAKTERTPRASCGKCGGHLGALRADADTPHFVGLPDLFAELDFQPTMHVWCKDSVITIDDDLPKHQEGAPTKGDTRG